LKYTDPDGHWVMLALGVAYVAWKLWGAYLDLVPAGQYIADPNSVDSEDLVYAGYDGILGWTPIYGDYLTYKNTKSFFADPIEYMTNPDAGYSPSEKAVDKLEGFISDKKTDTGSGGTSTGSSSKSSGSKPAGTPTTSQKAEQADSSKTATQKTTTSQSSGSSSASKPSVTTQIKTAVSNVVNTVKQAVTNAIKKVTSIFKSSKK
jgi:hypothetical protein